MCILHLNLIGHMHVVELCMQDDYISDTERYHAAKDYQASVDLLLDGILLLCVHAYTYATPMSTML